MEERIQKIISAAGVVSRRAAEELIREGRVRVNGTVVTEMGTKADPDKDHIKVDGKLINPQQPKTYLMLNKPVGYVTTMSDPEGRPVVADLLKGVKVRVYPVGRLDYDTEGLLLLTNDGDFAHLVTHPKHELPKTYLVKVKGVLSDSDVDNLEKGVFLKDGKTAPARVRRLRKEESNSYVEITIHEGRKRQVRRMIDYTGHSVIKLKRSKVGVLPLGDLELGAYRHLTSDEVRALQEASLREPGAETKPRSTAARAVKTDEKILKKTIRKKRSDDIEFIEPLTTRKPRRPAAAGRSYSADRPARAESRGPRSSDREAQGFDRPPRPSFRGKPEGAGSGFRSEGKRPSFRSRPEGDTGYRPRTSDRGERPSFRGKPEGRTGGFRPRSSDREAQGFDRPARPSFRGKPEGAGSGFRSEGKRPPFRSRPEGDTGYRPRTSDRGERPSFRGKPEGRTGGFRPRSSDREAQGFDRPTRPSFRGKPEGAGSGSRSEGKRPPFRSRPEGDTGYRPRTSDRGERPSFRGKPEGRTGGFRPRSSDREAQGFDRPARPSFRGKPEGAAGGFRSEGKRPSFRSKPEGGSAGFRPRTSERSEKSGTGSSFKPRERGSWGKGPARTSGFGSGSGRPRSSGPRPSRPAGKPAARKGRRD
ncbi:MAG: pseudouridine synthase [Nitrospirota bacterium]|nr:pseudouridine synthase [Nitrospirota bacterium]